MTMTRMVAGLVFVALTGCEGPAGADGVDGSDGANGADGVDGDNGADGADGADGASGADGADGVDGADGADGEDGQDGADGQGIEDLHSGEGPWGVDLEIVEVLGGSGKAGQLQAGDVAVVTYWLGDDDGVGYDPAEMYGIALTVAGPTGHYQVVFDDGVVDLGAESVENADGTWTVELPPWPDVYAPAPNDTPDIGAPDGDLSGEPLADGTYTVAMWAYLLQYTGDLRWYEAGNATFDVLVGAADAAEPYSAIDPDACASCHGDEQWAHGGMRREVGVCVTCHVAGAEDRFSDVDPSVTPGVSVAMGPMIHAIHNGSNAALPVEIAGYPANPAGEGYPDYNLHDFSDVTFPALPAGTAECQACHDGGVDPYGDATSPACTSCHNDVDVRTGANHPAGAWKDDDFCAVCHTPEVIEGYHADPVHDADLNLGLRVDVVGVSGGTGALGQLQTGDAVTVEFTLTHDDGTDADLAVLHNGDLLVAGPLEHMTETLSVSTTDLVDGAVWGGSSWTYTFADPWPATYPAQRNDTADLGVAQGDWSGQPVVDGTYRVALGASFDFADAERETRAAASDTLDVLVGAAEALDSRALVSDALCNGCHEDLVVHGDNRTGVAFCGACHTPGAEDRYSTDDPSTTPGVTIDLPVVIHKLHMGEELTEPYLVNGYGFPYTTHDYSDVVFPRFDGGPARCVACHTDGWEDATARGCVTCHDSSDAAAHAAIMTDDMYGESCDVCHGPGRESDVADAHRWVTDPE